MDLPGKIALITGAGKRIGATIALELAKKGVHVAIHYRDSRVEAQSVQHAILDLGGRADILQADLSQPDQAATLLPRAQDLMGPVEILINNASLFPKGGFATTDLAHWNQLLTLHLTTPFLLIQAMAGALGERPGKVVNILDQRVLRPKVGHLAYTVSKSGLAALTRIAALELAPRIQVNGVAPGPILPAPGDDEEQFRAIAKATPSARPGHPLDVARAVLFFLQHDYVTGQIMAVDGGEHL